MANNIPEILMLRKVRDSAIIVVLILLGTISFGLGRLSATNEKAGKPIILCEEVETALPAVSAASIVVADASEQGMLVASKNGTVYHFPWCPGAQRISESNKVWFATKEEAESAGYRPATNCRGL